ncbi:hypothetical protein Shyhy01_58650 [Streptomyces hygroscopicus subsp. hygroscopicus]|nr:hypothetical protein [Streptomyces hygroscopicus]GLX52915.1 hypothetical protein Shyhy01_58650 [Streptomyces hygroscopicus subsp. hygroscopicus]
MACDSDPQVLQKIADLKKDIGTVNTTLNTHVKNTGALTKTDKQDIINAIKGGPDEQKKPWEAFAEAIGLKDLFDAFKQLNPLTLAIAGVAAGIAFLKDKLFNIGKILNWVWEKFTGKIWTLGDHGLPQQQTRAEAEANNSLSVNLDGATPRQLNDLKTALNGLPPKIHSFNTKIREMKSPSAINKITTAVGKLKEKLEPNPAEDIREVATAIGELHTKLAPFDHDKLPKPRTLRDISDAAKELNRNAENVRKMFRDLATSATNAASAIA